MTFNHNKLPFFLQKWSWESSSSFPFAFLHQPKYLRQVFQRIPHTVMLKSWSIYLLPRESQTQLNRSVLSLLAEKKHYGIAPMSPMSFTHYVEKDPTLALLGPYENQDKHTLKGSGITFWVSFLADEAPLPLHYFIRLSSGATHNSWAWS